MGILVSEGIEALFDLIDERRGEPTAPAGMTRATAESVGGATFNQIFMAAGAQWPDAARVGDGPTLMYVAVLPYLGAALAAQEPEIPPPVDLPG